MDMVMDKIAEIRKFKMLNALSSIACNTRAEKPVEKIIAFNPPTQWIKEQVLSAGTSIGNVHFIKKTDGKLRKMCYRLHVQKPSIAKVPNSITKDTVTIRDVCIKCHKVKGVCNVGPFKSETVVTPVIAKKIDHKAIDKANDNITVLDCNAVVRDELGNIKGRGSWKTIPLNNITRIKAKGKEIIINKY